MSIVNRQESLTPIDRGSPGDTSLPILGLAPRQSKKGITRSLSRSAAVMALLSSQSLAVATRL